MKSRILKQPFDEQQKNTFVLLFGEYFHFSSSNGEHILVSSETEADVCRKHGWYEISHKIWKEETDSESLSS